MVLDGGPSTLVLDIKLDFSLETVLDKRRRTVVVLDIKVGSKLGNGLGLESGTAKSKMNMSVPGEF
jgi:hypothetical protein